MHNDSPQCIFDQEAIGDGFSFDCVEGFAICHVSRLNAGSGRLVRAQWTLGPGWNLLLANYAGSALVQAGSSEEWRLVTSNTLLFVRDTILDVALGRGFHDALAILWQSDSCMPLQRWIDGAIGDGQSGMLLTPFDWDKTETLDRLSKVLSDPATAEPRIFGLLLDVIPLMDRRSQKVNLMRVPSELPETIAALTRRVLRRPESPWPLKDAADQAGYSPFHFSRLFKQLVGYGFHEYVDRCRTSAAVDLLMKGQKSVDSISAATGFGTTQGLRESIKQHLGLIPSELRPT